MYCAFCHRPCGQREYCAEVCHQEHDDELKSFQQGNADELPIGDSSQGASRYGEWEPIEWDVTGGL
jgi:hypothetical protein